MKKAFQLVMLPLFICAVLVMVSCPNDNSGKEKEKFNINFNINENYGTVAADAKTAVQGKIITLTVMPNEGYKFVDGTLLVIGFDGSLADAEDDANGYKQYTFTMPGEDVTIVCQFEQIPAKNNSKTISPAAGMKNGTVLISPAQANPGDTVTLTVAADSGYQYLQDSLKINGAADGLKAISNDAQGRRRFTFTMPDADVTVSCSFEEISEQPTYSITVSSPISHGSVYTVPTSAKAGSSVGICVKANEGYAYQESSLKVNGSEEGINFSGEFDGDLWFVFKMPAEDVSIDCAFYDPTPVYYLIDTSGVKAGTVTPDVTQALKNTVITLTLKPNNNYEYIDGSLKVNNGTVTLTAISDNAQGNKCFTFVMPAENAMVSCTFVYNGPAVDYFSKDYDESITSFSDKFDTSGANHTAGGVNLNKWGFQNGNGTEYGNPGWGNGERQSYRTENVTVIDGILTINAKYVNPQVNSRSYTSGKLVTAKSQGNTGLGEPAAGAGTKFAQTYGRFEAKMRMHAGKGAWPAFWMMPVENTYGGWPRSGEIDIMEMTGIGTTHSSSTIHRAMQSNGNGQWYKGTNQDFENGSTFEDWHIYGVLWTETEMVFLIDGKEHGRHSITDARYQPDGNKRAPFDKNFFFIINLALDSGQFNKDNAIDNNVTTLNYTLEIEWVRAYTLANDPWTILGKVPGQAYNN